MSLPDGKPAADGDDISRAELLPFLAGRELRRAFLGPAIVTALFCLGLLSSTGDENGFFWLLSSYISVANLYLLYLCCGKKLPFVYLFAVAVFAFVLDAVLAPLIVASEKALPRVIAPGLIEETVKALPLLLVLAGSWRLSRDRRRKYGLREPLDGILLATASATGFAFLETMFIYVPHFGDLTSTPRLLDNIFCHIAFTGALGYFIGLAVLKHRHVKKVFAAIVLGFVVANVLHDLWDVVQFYTGVFVILSPFHFLIVAVMAFVVLASMILKGRDLSPSREFLWPRSALPPYRAPWVGPPSASVPPHLTAGDDISLAIGPTRVPLRVGGTLTVRDIPGLKAAADGIVAEVRLHPTEPDVMVLRNLSTATWEGVLPDGGVRDVEPARTVRIVDGLRLDFGTAAGTISVRSATPEPAGTVAEWC